MATRDEPAFPTKRFDNEMRDAPVGFHGLTKREYAAIEALAAVIIANGAQFFNRPAENALIAVAHADAVLAELARTP